MRSLFYVSARSSHLMEFKRIVPTYNVVSVKCHNVVRSLNSKAATNLKANLKGSRTLLLEAEQWGVALVCVFGGLSIQRLVPTWEISCYIQSTNSL